MSVDDVKRLFDNVSIILMQSIYQIIYLGLMMAIKRIFENQYFGVKVHQSKGCQVIEKIASRG